MPWRRMQRLGAGHGIFTFLQGNCPLVRNISRKALLQTDILAPPSNETAKAEEASYERMTMIETTQTLDSDQGS